eukprot:scaffold2093_cov161-Amphora_coffeaeformis.AAC.17
MVIICETSSLAHSCAVSSAKGVALQQQSALRPPACITLCHSLLWSLTNYPTPLAGQKRDLGIFIESNSSIKNRWRECTETLAMPFDTAIVFSGLSYYFYVLLKVNVPESVSNALLLSSSSREIRTND